MARLRNSKGQFISKVAEEGIRFVAEEQGVKNTDKIQDFFLQNETEFRSLFIGTHEAQFSTDNAGDYLNRNFDTFRINNGEETFKVSRTQAANLVTKFQRYQVNNKTYLTLLKGTMFDVDKNGAFHGLEINLPVKKKGGKFYNDSELKEAMIENEEIIETNSGTKAERKKKKKQQQKKRNEKKKPTQQRGTGRSRR